MAQENISQEAITVTPTLIIGLGGTGSLAIQFAKNSIKQHLKAYAKEVTTNKIPFIEYFSIDTTEQERKVSYLSSNEFMYIGSITTRDIQRMKDEHSAALKWFPDSLSSTQINAGARGVRHLGRLCFFKYKSRIQEELDKKINILKNLETLKSEIEDNFVNLSVDTQAARFNVHLITSLGGGTGSATLLDMAFLLKHMLSQYNPKISAHLVGPEAFESDNSINTQSKEYIKRNSAITICELERFIDVKQSFSPNAQISDGKKSAWSTDYIEGKITVKAKPFDFIYLLGNREGGDKRKVDQICETIGLSIAVETVRPETVELRGKLENFPGFSTNEIDHFKRLTTYSSYNVAILTPDLNEQSKIHLKDAIKNSILDSLLNKDINIKRVDNILEELRKAADMAGLPIKLNDEINDSLYSFLKKEIKIDKEDLFIETEATTRESSNKSKPSAPKLFGIIPRKISSKQSNQSSNDTKQLIDSKRKEIIIKAIENKSRRCQSDQLEAENRFISWKNAVENLLTYKISELLRDGHELDNANYTLYEIKAALDEYQNELDKAHKTSIKEYQKLFRIVPDPKMGKVGLEEWRALIDDLITNFNINKVNEIATKAFRIKMFYESIPKFQIQLLELFEKSLKNIKDHWKGAELNLIVSKSQPREESRRSALFDNSVVKLSEIDNIVRKDLRNNTKLFIENVIDKDANVLRFLSERKIGEKDNTQNIEIILERLFNEEYKRLRTKTDGIFTKNFDDGPPFSSVSEAGIHDLITLSGPLWNIETVGQKISPLSIVNIAKDTQLRKWISNRLGAIFFDIKRFPNNEDNIYANSLVIFQSEHGSCIAKLIVLDSCLELVDQKLKKEGKSDINELCLDPSWKIERPLTRKILLEFYKVFSLAMFFKFIVFEGAKYFFLEKEDQKVPLGETSGTNTMKRFEAFSFVVNEKINLKAKVEEKYLQEINEAAELKIKIEAYIQELQTDIAEFSENDENIEEKKEQLKSEINALQTLLIPDIDEAIKSQAKLSA